MGIVADRENLMAPAWSHVASDAGTTQAQHAELRAFAERIGRPVARVQGGTYLHLDVRGETRRRALCDPGVRVFPDTREMLRHLREAGAARAQRHTRR